MCGSYASPSRCGFRYADDREPSPIQRRGKYSQANNGLLTASTYNKQAIAYIFGIKTLVNHHTSLLRPTSHPHALPRPPVSQISRTKPSRLTVSKYCPSSSRQYSRNICRLWNDTEAVRGLLEPSRLQNPPSVAIRSPSAQN